LSDAPRLFHVVQAAAWLSQRAAGAAEWRPASLETEGFCHLSYEEQLEGTLAAHFAPSDELLLLELRPAGLAADLRLAAARGGALFPHLHRPLRPDDVLRELRLVHDGEAWVLDLPGADDAPAAAPTQPGAQP
jgi:uncharacterized protein (DUF952 family)